MEAGTIAILVVQGVIVILLGFNLRTGKDTNKEVGKINGKIGGLQIWAGEHEKKDDERFDNAKEFQKDIWGAVNKIKEKVGGG